jgi:ATP-dependent Zn protease
MTKSLRRARGPLLVLALLSLAVPAGAAAKPRITESYQALQAQINAGQVTNATIDKKAHTVKVTLTDGTHQETSYPSHQEPQLAAALKAKGAQVTLTKKKKKKVAAVHHRLRYIAGGILLVVIAIVGIVLFLHRRRPQAPAPAQEPSAPPATGSAEPAPLGAEQPQPVPSGAGEPGAGSGGP